MMTMHWYLLGRAELSGTLGEGRARVQHSDDRARHGYKLRSALHFPSG
jgi:hypothetical protein